MTTKQKAIQRKMRKSLQNIGNLISQEWLAASPKSNFSVVDALILIVGLEGLYEMQAAAYHTVRRYHH
jgi:hypothetical protein